MNMCWYVIFYCRQEHKRKSSWMLWAFFLKGGVFKSSYLKLEYISPCMSSLYEAFYVYNSHMSCSLWVLRAILWSSCRSWQSDLFLNRLEFKMFFDRSVGGDEPRQAGERVRLCPMCQQNSMMLRKKPVGNARMHFNSLMSAWWAVRHRRSVCQKSILYLLFFQIFGGAGWPFSNLGLECHAGRMASLWLDALVIRT